VIKNGESSNGGLMPQQGLQTPGWLPYFGHEDVERLLEEVPGIGGTVVVPAIHLPQDTAASPLDTKQSFAVIADPQGAVLAIFTGEYDD
jgi:predicted enzyme related to lactoylglutathione lyase